MLDDVAARLCRDVCCSYDMLVIGQCSVDPLGAMFHYRAYRTRYRNIVSKDH
jgi:hypothetical protein